MCGHAEIRVVVDTKVTNNGGRSNGSSPHTKMSQWSLMNIRTNDETSLKHTGYTRDCTHMFSVLLLQVYVVLSYTTLYFHKRPVA